MGCGGFTCKILLRAGKKTPSVLSVGKKCILLKWICRLVNMFVLNAGFLTPGTYGIFNGHVVVVKH